MNKITRFLTVTIVACLFLTACVATVPDAGEEPKGEIVVITPAIKGNSASLNVGDILEVQIPTIPTEGFVWLVQNLDTNILVQEGVAEYVKDSDTNSAGGIVTLRFKAVGIGKTNLSLLYVKSASGETPSLSSNSFGMAVEVK